MPVDEKGREIVVCLGSSCFARGNSQNLPVIEAYLKSHELAGSIRLTGRLCQDECKLGPNLTVCGQHHHEVNAARLRTMLQELSNGTG